MKKLRVQKYLAHKYPFLDKPLKMIDRKKLKIYYQHSCCFNYFQTIKQNENQLKNLTKDQFLFGLKTVKSNNFIELSNYLKIKKKQLRFSNSKFSTTVIIDKNKLKEKKYDNCLLKL